MDLVIELDSSSDIKFSKHLIVRSLVDGPFAFSSNVDMGVFVCDFVNFLQSRPGAAVWSHMVDKAVYTRSRCFRMLFSTKYGQGRPLRLLRGALAVEPEVVQLLESLVTFLSPSTIVIEYCRARRSGMEEQRRGRPGQTAIKQRPRTIVQGVHMTRVCKYLAD